MDILSSCSTEIILNIATWIRPLQSLNALCRVNHRLNLVLELILYQQDALHSYPYSVAISWAAKYDNMPLFQKAIDFGAKIPLQAIRGHKDRYGKSYNHPLTLAVESGHDDIVAFLLKKGCSLHMRNADNLSMLELAVMGGHPNLIKLFLDLGVRHDWNSLDSHSPIRLAAFYGDDVIVELLLCKDEERMNNLPTNTQMEDALMTALIEGHSHIVPQLLKFGMSVNFRFYADSYKSGYNRPTPLDWALDRGDFQQAKAFLDNGAKGGRALREAVERGRVDAIVFLCQEIDCSNVDWMFSTMALGRAVDLQEITIIEIMLAKGVQCDFRVSDRYYPLPPHGFSAGPPDFDDEYNYIPPLVRAVNLGDLSLVQLLSSYGADVNTGYHEFRRRSLEHQATKSHMSCARAIHLAMDLEHHSIVKFLLQSGADISFKPDIWIYHTCKPIDQQTYFKVSEGLKRVQTAMTEVATTSVHSTEVAITSVRSRPNTFTHISSRPKPILLDCCEGGGFMICSFQYAKFSGFKLSR